MEVKLAVFPAQYHSINKEWSSNQEIVVWLIITLISFLQKWKRHLYNHLLTVPQPFSFSQPLWSLIPTADKKVSSCISNIFNILDCYLKVQVNSPLQICSEKDYGLITLKWIGSWNNDSKKSMTANSESLNLDRLLALRARYLRPCSGFLIQSSKPGHEGWASAKPQPPTFRFFVSVGQTLLFVTI